MKIEATKVIIGVAVGGLDELLDRRDLGAVPKRVEPFRTVRDWGRTALTALGYLGQAFDFYPDIAAPLAQSQVPLFTKSVIGAVLPREEKAVERRVNRVQSNPAQSRITHPQFRQLTAVTPAIVRSAAAPANTVDMIRSLEMQDERILF